MSMLEYFIENELLTVCQFRSLPGDSCTSQLLITTHGIQKSFDEIPPIYVTGVSLDKSKVFDKV